MTDEEIGDLFHEQMKRTKIAFDWLAFARRIEAETIKRCAKVCEDYETSDHSCRCASAQTGYWPDQVAHRLAAAIRELGEKK